MTNDNRDPNADYYGGKHVIGDLRTVHIYWSNDRYDLGWHWKAEGLSAIGGPFDTSTDAYRAVLMVLG